MRGEVNDQIPQAVQQVVGAEALLRAAIDYAQEKFIAYCAAKPPSARCVARAEARGKRIIHLSLALLSPDRVKRMREMHLLATYEHRRIAHRYIPAPPHVHSKTREHKQKRSNQAR